MISWRPWRLGGSISLGMLVCGCDEFPETQASQTAATSATSESSAEAIGPSPAPSASTSAAPPRTVPPLPLEDLIPKTLDEQREAMLSRMRVMLELEDAKIARVKAILDRSKILGQGNPEITAYAMTRRECRERRQRAGVVDEYDDRCGPFMAPLWDPKAGEASEQARVCIDRYEFPGIPCEYPVTWVSPRDGAELCGAVGKRICDAHEWEGACAGALNTPEKEYAFGQTRRGMKESHNADRERVWAYGPDRNLPLCATDSVRSKKCKQSGWKNCGSNTYPAGSFPACKSAFGVFDLHGNAAEHMNLPMKPEQMASRGGSGETEMKGSWFIFSKFDAHEDDCRWRAPDWHVTKLMYGDGHANYHLGLRCCKDVKPPSPASL